ncbi:ferredoxin:protochlorophyllide reductase (ATP-dependent) subunit B [Heliorestis convoluta]|uniref:Light-independent protochlorophyllide reductase subunit B n=1 Tax=Heliorestis convoluta TaxID=356322 RepID=A0A5Q2N541_9FIRM|nr:ferredoxin:protochlorophyllide reductase (ATP-dependent) subunit B [Heliorestis convoluta]QGG48736.1 Light-independent protochlorophyllide reductase subunit B [Heliorestis convoluta]
MKLAYWMYEGTALSGIARVTGSMKKIHTVIHGPQGDSYISVMFSMLERFHELPPFTLSAIGRREMAKGSRARLVETVLRVDQEHQPDVIVITPTCSSTLLQEDLQAVAHTLQARTKATLLVPKVNAFRDLEHYAMDQFLTQMVSTFAEERSKTERFSVNIIGPSYLGFQQLHDLEEIKKTFDLLGIDVNLVIPYGASVADLRNVTKAHLNVSLYGEYGSGLCKYLQEHFGMEYLSITPLGIRMTGRFLEEIGEKAAIDVKPYIRQQVSPASLISRCVKSVDALSSLYGKRAVVFGDYSHAVGVTYLLREIGLKVEWAGTYMTSMEKQFQAELEGLTEEVFVCDDFQKISNKIKETQPDIVFGTQMERHSSARHDLPCVVISSPAHILNFPLYSAPILGYGGMARILDTINGTIKLGLEEHLVNMFGEDNKEAEETSALQTASAAQANVQSLQGGELPWTPEAMNTLKQIPFFVRGKVQRNTETYAREKGHKEVTLEVIYAAKAYFEK